MQASCSIPHQSLPRELRDGHSLCQQNGTQSQVLPGDWRNRCNHDWYARRIPSCACWWTLEWRGQIGKAVPPSICWASFLFFILAGYRWWYGWLWCNLLKPERHKGVSRPYRNQLGVCLRLEAWNKSWKARHHRHQHVQVGSCKQCVYMFCMILSTIIISGQKVRDTEILACGSCLKRQLRHRLQPCAKRLHWFAFSFWSLPFFCDGILKPEINSAHNMDRWLHQRFQTLRKSETQTGSFQRGGGLQQGARKNFPSGRSIAVSATCFS